VTPVPSHARIAAVTNPTPIPPSREEARLRLVCAALTGLLAKDNNGTAPNWYAQIAIQQADAALALLYPEPPKEKP